MKKCGDILLELTTTRDTLKFEFKDETIIAITNWEGHNTWDLHLWRHGYSHEHKKIDYVSEDGTVHVKVVGVDEI